METLDVYHNVIGRSSPSRFTVQDKARVSRKQQVVENSRKIFKKKWGKKNSWKISKGSCVFLITNRRVFKFLYVF